MPHLVQRTFNFLAIVAAALWLAACGAPPKLVGEKVHEGPGTKTDRVMVFYFNEDLTATPVRSSSPPTSNSHLLLRAPARGFRETGLEDFGPLVVKAAPAAFAKQKVEVVRADVIPAGQWQSVGPKLLGEVPADRRRGSLIITIIPRNGRSTATSAEAHVTIQFGVRVIDVNSLKPRWEGAIEAYTYTGNSNFGNKGTNFDEVYAQQFMDLVLDNLRKNGVL